MLLESFFTISLVMPGLSLLRIMGIKTRNRIEQLILSYIISLVVMFVVLYVGGILMTFIIASYVYALIAVLSLVYLGVVWARNAPSLESLKLILAEMTSGTLILWTSALALLLVYAVVLPSRALLDSDVIQYYLPFAREIVRGGGFTYSTGYDYNTFLKPIGASVLYAWTYVISGSLMAESFRLMPLVPILLMVLMTYAIAVEATESQRIGTVATVIFMLLPFHDRFLYYNAFYPDTFYYPLIFFVIYGVLRYSKTRDIHLLFWIGCAFGVAGLIKAQTIFYLIAFLLCLLAIEIKNKKFVFLFALLTPFSILIPNILAEMNSQGIAGLVLGAESVALMLFAALVIGTTYTFFEPESSVELACPEKHDLASPTVRERNALTRLFHRNSKRYEPSPASMFMTFIMRSLWVIIPFITLASLWYLNNFLRYGSLVYTSSVDIPNIEWAIDIVNSVLQPDSNVGYEQYFQYLFFAFVDPAVMGYVWLIPLLVGLALSQRARNNGLAFLLFYTVVVIALIFSQTAYYINPYGVSVINPRDLLPAAPMLSVVASIAICSVVPTKRQSPTSRGQLFMPMLLVAYFGFMSYLHSVYLYFAATVLPTAIYSISGLLILFGLTLQQTSFQLWPIDRIHFLSMHVGSVLALSLVVAIPFFLMAMMNLLNVSMNSGEGLEPRIIRSIRYWYHQIRRRVQWPSVSNRRMITAKNIGIILLISSVIIVPRGIILAAQGGPSESRDFQLSHYYGPFYELLMEHDSEIHGDILTFSAPPGLQYYILDVNIIDLRYAANLAYLRECFNSTSAFDSSISLRQKGIRHLLLNPAISSDIDIALNNVLSSITSNSNLSVESRTYGSWVLYDLGPFELLRTAISPTGWTLDSRYNTGPGVFENNETGIVLELSSGASGDRMAIANYKLPHLNLSDCVYLSMNIYGSSNARVLFRFYLENGTSVDMAYWQAPSQITHFNLKPYDGNLLRGDAYMSLISSDGQPASATVIAISLVDLVPILKKDAIPLDGWSVDSRYTTGPFNFDSNDTGLILELSSGLFDNRLTIVSFEIPHVSLLEYDYLLINMAGSSNARLLFRVYLENGSSLDLAYWAAPLHFQAMISIPQSDVAFGGTVYIGLMSSDGTPCSVAFTETALLHTDRPTS